MTCPSTYVIACERVPSSSPPAPLLACMPNLLCLAVPVSVPVSACVLARDDQNKEQHLA